ncbi:MAG: hypothetical protein OEO82_12430, partial [Gammaproteobacteria bacterium]|nr:hypothetical protein [Gammaproteobacteria bacterium]
MRLLICASLVLAGCAEADRPPRPDGAITVAGRLESKALDETSGLARSQRHEGLLWAVNDDGPAVLYALDTSGGKRGKVKLSKARNRDWEDLASFTLDDQPYLLVADIGDNERRRKDVRLYVVAEPEPDEDKVKIAWRIEFSYPEGPRDAEAVAVDSANERILVLTKRDIPAVLYALPLRPETDDTISAERLGAIGTLPRPSNADIDNARVLKDWHWQPTGLDISSDDGSILILTYRGVYYYPR